MTTFDRFYEELAEVSQLRQLEEEMRNLPPVSSREIFWKHIPCGSTVKVSTKSHYKPNGFRGVWPYPYDPTYTLRIQGCPCSIALIHSADPIEEYMYERELSGICEKHEDKAAYNLSLEKRKFLLQQIRELKDTVYGKCFDKFPKETIEAWGE